MGFPDLQDGRPPPGDAGAELTSGPVAAEMPDEGTTGRPPPAPGAEAPPWRASSTAGSRPAGRAGAHRRSVTSPQKQPWPAAPSGARRGPLRGFPPGPGQPDPVYPPGQFSPWNRASTRSAWLGIAGNGGGTADTDPGYSALAMSDAAADLTSTQTWAVIDDELPANPSLPARGARDWGSHTGEPPWQRAAADRAPGSRAPGGRGPGNQAAGGRAPGYARGAGRPGAGAVADERGHGPARTGRVRPPARSGLRGRTPARRNRRARALRSAWRPAAGWRPVRPPPVARARPPARRRRRRSARPSQAGGPALRPAPAWRWKAGQSRTAAAPAGGAAGAPS